MPTREADGLFNQTQCRLAYIAHLKTARRSTAHLAAQAEDHKQKAKLLELRVREGGPDCWMWSTTTTSSTGLLARA